MLENKTKVLFTYVRIFLGSDKLTILVLQVIKKRSATDSYGSHNSCVAISLVHILVSLRKKGKKKKNESIKVIVFWIVLSYCHTRASCFVGKEF